MKIDRSNFVKANETSGQHGRTVNALAAQGTIRAVKILTEGKEIFCNSTWAATDFLKSNGFYELGTEYKIEYVS